MADIVFGEIDWNSGDAGNNNSKTSDFMRLEEGESVVRVMGNPVQFYVHWVTTADGSTRKINSPIDSPDLVRKLEDAGYRRQPRWIVKVLDRSDETFKLLEIGSQIYSGIRSLYNHPKWGKVTQYDVSVIRGPKGTQPLYSVTPNPKEALDSGFKTQFVDFNDRVNVDKLISPMDPGEVCDLMGWQVTSGATTESSETDDMGEFDFSFDD